MLLISVCIAGMDMYCEYGRIVSIVIGLGAFCKCGVYCGHGCLLRVSIFVYCEHEYD